jgi:hypothetical protein
MNLDEIMGFITDDPERSLEKLLESLNLDSSYYKELILAKSSWTERKRQNRLGIISSEDFMVSRNRFIYILLEVIESLKKEEVITKSVEENTNSKEVIKDLNNSIKFYQNLHSKQKEVIKNLNNNVDFYKNLHSKQSEMLNNVLTNFDEHILDNRVHMDIFGKAIMELTSGKTSISDTKITLGLGAILLERFGNELKRIKKFSYGEKKEITSYGSKFWNDNLGVYKDGELIKYFEILESLCKHIEQKINTYAK